MTNTFTCVIIDDEKDAIELLESRLNLLFDNVIVSDTFTGWSDAASALHCNKYDIVFIDVSMPGKNGFELLKLIPGLNAEIVFVTAYDDFALPAFSVAASGYILKPVDDGDLLLTVNRCIDRLRYKHIAETARFAPKVRVAEKVGISNNHGIDYVNITDILYLESINKCTIIITHSGKFTTSNALSVYKHLVDNHSFFQVHRSFIINLNAIARYESSGLIIMQDKKEIPLSRNFKNDFLRLFENI